MKKTILRAACESDAAQIAQLYNFYIENTTATMEMVAISADEMRARIAQISQEGWFIVLEEEGQILGYAYAKPWHTRAGLRFTFESSIYLAPAFCGSRDLGKMLYSDLLEKVRASQQVAVLLGVITSENEASKRFHEKMGFSHAATLENVCFKSGRWLDMVFYRLAMGADVQNAR